MMSRILVPAVLAAGLALAGCAESGLSGSNLTTASVGATATAKADPACTPLSQQINALRSEGIADKVAKASAKKYKMTTADLAKADQLNKANADFQAKCSTLPAQQVAQAAVPAPVAAAANQAANAATAKAVNIGTERAVGAGAKAAAAAVGQ